MSDWIAEHFKGELLTKDGVKNSKTVLAGKKATAIYFSAHWCPPCRGFTPLLAEFYEQLKEGNEDTLEIVFVSSDHDEAAFNEYYGSMPWTAVPFADRDCARNLGQKYGVRGIPTLIVLNSEGNVVDRDGRSTVSAARGNTAAALEKWK